MLSLEACLQPICILYVDLRHIEYSVKDQSVHFHNISANAARTPSQVIHGGVEGIARDVEYLTASVQRLQIKVDRKLFGLFLEAPR